MIVRGRVYPVRMSWRDSPTEQQTERDRMPYMQIAPDLWVVIRESMEHPKAIIQQVTARDQTARYLLFTWDVEPSRRRLHGMYDTLEEANWVVKWPSPKPDPPGAPPTPWRKDGP